MMYHFDSCTSIVCKSVCSLTKIIQFISFANFDNISRDEVFYGNRYEMLVTWTGVFFEFILDHLNITLEKLYTWAVFFENYKKWKKSKFIFSRKRGVKITQYCYKAISNKTENISPKAPANGC